MARRKRPSGVKLEPSYLREWRDYRGFTQEQVGEALEVDPTALSRIERGATPWDQFWLQQLSALYKCSIDDLINRDPRREKPIDKLQTRVAKLHEPEHIRAAMALVDSFLSKR